MRFQGWRWNRWNIERLTRIWQETEKKLITKSEPKLKDVLETLRFAGINQTHMNEINKFKDDIEKYVTLETASVQFKKKNQKCARIVKNIVR